jgi:hypothetical protein
VSRISHLPIEGEVWKPVPGFDGCEASNEGRIRHIKKSGRARILVSSPGAYGYVYVQPFRDEKRLRRGVHQLVAAAFIGPCPEGMEVNHIDLDKSNNRPSNLEYLTHLDNIRHARATRIWNTPYGEASPNAKLTEQQVAEIRASGLSQRNLATMYGVSQPLICYIKSGKQWKKAED